MIDVLAIVVALFLLCGLLALLGTVVFRGSGFSFRGWQWHPNMVGLTVVVLAGALILWRFFPEFLFIPIILPFFWFGRGRSHRGPTWTVPHRAPPPANPNAPDDRAIDAQFRRVQDQ
jgi:hypothetical protein